MISRCYVRYENASVWSLNALYERHRPLQGELEFRGDNGAAGSWIMYIIDVPPGSPPQFRWTDDLGRTWHEGGP